MVRTVAAVVVAVIVITAGCGGFLPGGSTSPTVPDGAVPPGASSDGVENATALFNAHMETLAATSFEWTATFNVTLAASTGTTSTQTTSQHVVSGSEYIPYLIESTSTSSGQRLATDYWGNTSVGFMRQQQANRTQYRGIPPSFDRRNALGYPSSLAVLVELADYTVAATNDSGADTRLTYEADAVDPDFDSQSGSLPAENVSNLSSRLVVDSDGLIHTIDITFDTTTPQGTASYDISYSLDAVGGIDVPVPDWIESAARAVPTLELDTHIQGDIVILTHQGGDPLPAGSIIGIETNETTYSGTVPTTIETDEHLYVAMNASGSLAVSTTANVTGTSLPSSAQFYVYSPNATLLYNATMTTNQTTTS